MQDFYLAYARGAEAMTQAYFPFLKGVTQCNLEAVGFLNRRAQAYLEISSRLGQYRTPHDYFDEQVRFWREASEQYAESSRKMLAVWTKTSSITAHAATGPATVPNGDYIEFPKPKQGHSTARSSRGQSNGVDARSRVS